ncbi:hypothetical protein EVAR_2450_1 [Eumeta japonica]|uniref:Uncharacterized protein n=1 Tax=Eumeta variegata TaxID=151549 RepID=A0A4C1SR69_EUMVA|nr:hypothetical protein EVAR_2450_1 [Eumeta japonica]
MCILVSRLRLCSRGQSILLPIPTNFGPASKRNFDPGAILNFRFLAVDSAPRPVFSFDTSKVTVPICTKTGQIKGRGDALAGEKKNYYLRLFLARSRSEITLKGRSGSNEPLRLV